MTRMKGSSIGDDNSRSHLLSWCSQLRGRGRTVRRTLQVKTLSVNRTIKNIRVKEKAGKWSGLEWEEKSLALNKSGRDVGMFISWRLWTICTINWRARREKGCSMQPASAWVVMGMRTWGRNRPWMERRTFCCDEKGWEKDKCRLK